MLAFSYVTENTGNIGEVETFHPIYFWHKYTIGLAGAFRIVSSGACLPLRREGRLGMGCLTIVIGVSDGTEPDFWR